MRTGNFRVTALQLLCSRRQLPFLSFESTQAIAMVASGGGMTKKWYNYFVSVDEANSALQGSSAAPNVSANSKSPAQSVAEIASSVATEPTFTTPVSDPTSFDEIYKAAEIPAPPHGYSILKVGQMLESEHIRSLPSDVKKSSV